MKTKKSLIETENLLSDAWRSPGTIHVSEVLPGPSARRWIEHYERFAAPSTYIYPFVWDVTGTAQGPFCADPDRNVFLDFYGHVGAAPLGYNHPKILRDCGVPFDPIKSADHDTYLASGPDPDRPKPVPAPGGAAAFQTPGHLQERLLESARGFGYDCVFLVNSGAEANENAFKIAFHRKYREVRASLGEHGYRELFRQLGIQEDAFLDDLYQDYPFFGLAAHNGFHGRTLGVLSATHSKKLPKLGFPRLRWIRHFEFNAPTSEIEALVTGESLQTLLRQERLAQTIFQDGKVPRELLAFVILEPIQGEGGYIFPEKHFLAEVARFAKTHGALFIADEVQVGLGRTGTWWASEQFGITPDLMTSSKALRVGAVMGKREVFPQEPGVLSSTWGGGSIACAVGAKTLQIIQEEGLLLNVAKRGKTLLQGLERLALRHPVVTGIRGLGLLAAMDLASEEIRDAVVQAAFRRGFLVLGCGKQTIRFLPPLNVQDREIEMAVRVLEETLATLQSSGCSQLN